MSTTADHEDWTSEDVEETEESEFEEAEAVTYEIAHYPADFPLESYLSKHKDGQLVLPPFQRQYVWNQVKASKLVESFLLGLPVPAVFLYKERETNRLVVIDGQQRIFSCIRFFQNDFDGKPFHLKGVGTKRWKDRSYAELDERDQYQLRDSVLRATVVQQLDPKDDSSIYQIFERLNTGGVNLTAMEIRKCVYYGDFFNLLEHLNLNANWRVLIGKAKPDIRYRDVEFILRILALRERWTKYQKPMKGFLNTYMADKRRLAPTDEKSFLARTASTFESVCDYAVHSLGPKPFHLRGRLNYAVMDSVMCAAFEASCHQVKDFGERFGRLKASEEYVEYATSNTSDERALKERFTLAMEYLAS